MDGLVRADFYLARHPCRRSLKHSVCGGLDHRHLLAVGGDEYVIGRAVGKGEGALTGCFNRIGSYSAGRGHDNDPIDADRSEGNREGAISIEVNAFNDGFWLRNATDDVESSRGKYIRAEERLRAANLRLGVRPRGAR